MAYSGLETLFQNLGPTGAAMIAGEREGLAQQESKLAMALQQQAIKAAQQKNAQDALMDPLRLQELSLKNQGSQLGLAGIAGDSRSRVAKGKVDEATVDSTIAGTNATNQGKVTKEQFDRFTTFTKMAGQFGEMLENIPSAAQPSAKIQFMQESGIDPRSTLGQKILQAKGSDLVGLSRKMSQMSDDYIKSMDVAKLNRDSAEKIAGGNNATELQIAREGIAAGKYAPRASAGGGSAAEKIKLKLLSMPPANRLGAVQMILESGIDPLTGEALTTENRSAYERMYEQDTRTVNAGLEARTGQGIVPQPKAGGGIELGSKVPPRVDRPPEVKPGQQKKPLSAY